jgi:hypothetical protein
VLAPETTVNCGRWCVVVHPSRTPAPNAPSARKCQKDKTLLRIDFGWVHFELRHGGIGKLSDIRKAGQLGIEGLRCSELSSGCSTSRQSTADNENRHCLQEEMCWKRGGHCKPWG